MPHKKALVYIIQSTFLPLTGCFAPGKYNKNNTHHNKEIVCTILSHQLPY